MKLSLPFLENGILLKNWNALNVGRILIILFETHKKLTARNRKKKKRLPQAFHQWIFIKQNVKDGEKSVEDDGYKIGPADAVQLSKSSVYNLLTYAKLVERYPLLETYSGSLSAIYSYGNRLMYLEDHPEIDLFNRNYIFEKLKNKSIRNPFCNVNGAKKV